MICKAAKEQQLGWSCESSCPYTLTCEMPKEVERLKAEVERLGAYSDNLEDFKDRVENLAPALHDRIEASLAKK